MNQTKQVQYVIRRTNKGQNFWLTLCLRAGDRLLKLVTEWKEMSKCKDLQKHKIQLIWIESLALRKAEDAQ